jgi:hypothetical protein
MPTLHGGKIRGCNGAIQLHYENSFTHVFLVWFVIIRVVIVATCNIIFFHLLSSSIMDGERETQRERKKRSILIMI